MRAANVVEETTTSIAGTGGNGAVALAAVAGRPRFSTVFGTATIRYVIEDTANGRFETGIGTVGGNTLVRSRPQTTWDGSTYNDKAPAPLAFGSSPASGVIRVRMAPTAEAQGVVLPGVNSTITDGSGKFTEYPISNIRAIGDEYPYGSALTASREYYSCYRLDVPGLLVGIRVAVEVASAGSSLKTALYDVAPNGLPGQKITDFNVLSSATTGDKVDTNTATWSVGGPIWLPAGWYYVAFISDGTPEVGGIDTFNYYQGFPPRTPLGQQDSGYGNTCYAAGSYAAGLPAAPSPTAVVPPGSYLSLPNIGLKVVP